LELYAYEFSEMLGLEMGPGGRYFSNGWPWNAESERIWLAYVNEHPAGFAIATLGSVIDSRADVWDMHEFFVVRRHQRARLGTQLARAVWQHQPGIWDVRIIEPNKNALAFWQHAVEEAAGHATEPQLVTNSNSGKSEHLFRFKPNPELVGQDWQPKPARQR
jgi:predicted acetyltransferase